MLVTFTAQGLLRTHHIMHIMHLVAGTCAAAMLHVKEMTRRNFVSKQGSAKEDRQYENRLQSDETFEP